MSEQLAVALQSNQHESEVELSGSEEGRETQLFWYEYLSRRATADAEVREDDALVIQRERTRVRGSDAAAQVAGRLADLGK